MRHKDTPTKRKEDKMETKQVRINMEWRDRTAFRRSRQTAERSGWWSLPARIPRHSLRLCHELSLRPEVCWQHRPEHARIVSSPPALSACYHTFPQLLPILRNRAKNTDDQKWEIKAIQCGFWFALLNSCDSSISVSLFSNLPSDCCFVSCCICFACSSLLNLVSWTSLSLWEACSKSICTRARACCELYRSTPTVSRRPFKRFNCSPWQRRTTTARNNAQWSTEENRTKWAERSYLTPHTISLSLPISRSACRRRRSCKAAFKRSA